MTATDTRTLDYINEDPEVWDVKASLESAQEFLIYIKMAYSCTSSIITSIKCQFMRFCHEYNTVALRLAESEDLDLELEHLLDEPSSEHPDGNRWGCYCESCVILDRRFEANVQDLYVRKVSLWSFGRRLDNWIAGIFQQLRRRGHDVPKQMSGNRAIVGLEWNAKYWVYG